MKKRIVNGTLAAMMIFALTACGQKEETPADPETASVSEENSEAQEARDMSEDSRNVQESEKPQEEQAKSDSNTLVIYFSATGNTKKVAGYLTDILGADIYEIVPEEPYTSEDLDWTDSSSRASMEHADPDFRPAVGGEPVELDGYDRIFLGYPLWWGEAPNILLTFMENVDLSGKTIIPFCTSASSDMGSSADNLKAFAPDADWQEGQRFKSSAQEEDVSDWVNNL